MIEQTEEMLEAFRSAYRDSFKSALDGRDDQRRAGIQAVLALIDPVRNEVRKARIVSSDWEFYRIMAGEDGDVPTGVWMGECCCHYYTWQQLMQEASEANSEVEWS